MRRDRYDAGVSAPAQLRGRILAAALAAAAVLPAAAQNYPITANQRDTAQLVAQRGIPLDQLAPNAPDTYVVKRGDTLWAISGLYLRQPWRWPELWGMNLDAIRNPHLIYPGQTLYLDKTGGYARLRTTPPGTPVDETAGLPTVRLSPRARTENLADNGLPTLPPHLIEPFLAEPLVVAEDTLQFAPRVVATTDDRVLVARGDRLYARSSTPGQPLALGEGLPRQFRVFRNAVPLIDPITGEILGYEAQYLGRADLARSEGVEAAPPSPGTPAEIVPATLDVVSVKEEIRAGDRLLPEPERQFRSYTPYAPREAVDARVVSLYGSNTVTFVAQNQIIAINRGTRDGIAAGAVLSLLSEGARIVDKTADGNRDLIKLPSEPNGLGMVFRTFDRVSYVLVLNARVGVKVGDRLVNPTR